MMEQTMWDRFCCWLAYRLPERVVFWCYIRKATQAMSRHPDKTPDEVGLLEPLR
ncbi:MAG: hypothetical protein ACYTG0_25045 [Planctomycetota bacterium]|jgi:hypothetical protein